jgi:hypothetical protein
MTCLKEVIDYLEHIPEVITEELILPLRVLLNELRRLVHGENPSFFHVKRQPHSPAQDTDEQIRGKLAALCEFLVGAV